MSPGAAPPDMRCSILFRGGPLDGAALSAGDEALRELGGELGRRFTVPSPFPVVTPTGARRRRRHVYEVVDRLAGGRELRLVVEHIQPVKN